VVILNAEDDEVRAWSAGIVGINGKSNCVAILTHIGFIGLAQASSENDIATRIDLDGTTRSS
jgi:hypothetical protein